MSWMSGKVFINYVCSAGHTEKAVACLQTMVELNCFCSPDLEKNTPVAGQMAFLETFWDSGQPRYGAVLELCSNYLSWEGWH